MPEADVGHVFLFVGDEELRQARRLADDSGSTPRRERIERAGVADARCHQRPPRDARRRRATSGPRGLSMTRTPFMQQSRLQFQQCRSSSARPTAMASAISSRMPSRTAASGPAREAGGVLVAAAAERVGDAPDVDVVLRSHADADVAVGAELEEHHRLDLARGQRQVDQPFGVVVRAAAGVRACRRRGTAPPAGRRRASSISSSSAPISFSLPKLLLSKTRRAIAAGLTPGFDRLPADVERPRRDVRVMERAGVGEDRQVDVRGDLDRQRHAERAR